MIGIRIAKVRATRANESGRNPAGSLWENATELRILIRESIARVRLRDKKRDISDVFLCNPFQHGSQLLMNYESARHSIATWNERDVLPGHELAAPGGDPGSARWRDSASSSGDSSSLRGGSDSHHASAESVRRAGSSAARSRGSSFTGHDFVDNTEHCSYDTVIRRKSSGSESSNEHPQRIPTKLLPNLPVTTEVTKQLSEQVAAHAQQRRSDETLKRIKHGQSRSNDPPPPPPPVVAASEVHPTGPGQHFPPPPSPLVNSPRRSLGTPGTPKHSTGGGDQGPFATRVSDTPTGIMVGVVGRSQQQHHQLQQQQTMVASPAKPPLPPDHVEASKHIGAMNSQQIHQQQHPNPPMSPLTGVHGAHIMNSHQGVAQSVPNSPMHTAHAHAPHAGMGHRRSGSTGAPPPTVAPKPKPPAPQRGDSASKLVQPVQPAAEAKPNFMEDLQRVLAQKQGKSGTTPAPTPAPKPPMSPQMHNHNQGSMSSPAHSAKPPQHGSAREPHYRAPAPVAQHQPPPMSPGLENPEDLPPPPAELLEGLPSATTPSLKKKPPPPPRRSSETHLSSPRHQQHKPT